MCWSTGVSIREQVISLQAVPWVESHIPTSSCKVHVMCIKIFFVSWQSIALWISTCCKLITRIAQALSVHVSLFTSIRLPELFFLLRFVQHLSLSLLTSGSTSSQTIWPNSITLGWKHLWLLSLFNERLCLHQGEIILNYILFKDLVSFKNNPFLKTLTALELILFYESSFMWSYFKVNYWKPIFFVSEKFSRG